MGGMRNSRSIKETHLRGPGVGRPRRVVGSPDGPRLACLKTFRNCRSSHAQVDKVGSHQVVVSILIDDIRIGFERVGESLGEAEYGLI